MNTRPVSTVQPFGKWQRVTEPRTQKTTTQPQGAMIRLRGKWVSELFAVGTRLQVTREERAGKLVLVLEAAR